ncbi:MAG: ATPase, T2SS/T4P/T4SS family [Phototrophicaceae bacterium]
MEHNPNGKPPQNNNDDSEPTPEFLASKTGRSVSFFGLVERIVAEFELEHGQGESEAIKASTNDVERRQLLRDVADYIFGIESVHLSPHEQARIMAMANAEIFGYGPLDPFFADETVSTISLEGSRKIGLRYAPAQELQTLDPIFDDTPHMRRIIQRLLRDAGADLDADVPIIETGLIIQGRRVAVSVAKPPFVSQLSVDIRVHPTQAPTFDTWIEAGILNEKTRDLLIAIAQSEHGFIVVGDTESGKTTLVSMMLQAIQADNLVSVERASELRLPDGAERLSTQWAIDLQSEITFGEQIQAAIAKNTQIIVIDEIRADEPHSIAPLLINDNLPRQIWSFRGASEAKRLTSALGMLARMADGTQPEYMVQQLYKRLPFVIIIKRRKEKLQIREIAEWQFSDGEGYADFVSLMRVEWDECNVTGKKPQHILNLPNDFWSI